MTIALFFGGVSPEHEVSVITSLQAAAALGASGQHRILPVYVAKDGRWRTGAHLLDPATFTDLDAALARSTPLTLDPSVRGVLALDETTDGAGRWGGGTRTTRHRADVAFLGFHGGAGENGAFQGLFEVVGVPYTGSGVFGSALGMDKVLSKMLCRDQAIPVVEWVALREHEWAGHEEAGLDRIEADLGLPVVVKPARLGSSIGITFCRTREALAFAMEEAFRYDEKVVVERAVRGLREVNCSVLGDPNDAIPSVLEEPVRTAGESLLTFEEKYLRGGGGKGGKTGAGDGPAVRYGTKGAPRRAGSAGMASLDRLIPAPLDAVQTAEIRALAVRVFQLFECSGVARLDFMIETEGAHAGRVYFNEINTIPGSLSFYLWEPTGVPFDMLTERLVEIAVRRRREARSRVSSFSVNLLSQKSLGGLKGAKGRA